jgi:tRNA dimethylallyltransferase
MIAGPTAAGKTALSIELARNFRTAIISADSRQCYQELSIGVARPSQDELQAAPHYFIASHSIHQPVHAADFERLSLDWAQEIFSTKDVLIIVGGTGLYLKAFAEGLDSIPPIDASIRLLVQEEYSKHGIGWLQAQIRSKDPLFAATNDMNNPHRIMRALEVFMQTGMPIRDFQKGIRKARPFELIKIGISPDRHTLYQRINQRVDQMVADGQLAEVERLQAFQHLVPLQTVGYQEYFDWMNGNTTLEKAIELVKQHTRNYAKRQLTWFKKDADMVWFAPEQIAEIIQYVSLQR